MRFRLLRARVGVFARALQVRALRGRLHVRDLDRRVALAKRRVLALVGVLSRGVERGRGLVAYADGVTLASFGILQFLFDGGAVRFNRGHARVGGGGARVGGRRGVGGLFSLGLEVGGHLVALADRFEGERLGLLNFLIGGSATRLVFRGADVDRLLRYGEIGLQLRERFAQLRRLLTLLPELAIERRAARVRFLELVGLAAGGRVRLLRVGGALVGRALRGRELLFQLRDGVVQLRRGGALLFERGIELRAARALLLERAFELFDLTAGGGIRRFGGERLLRGRELAAQHAELLGNSRGGVALLIPGCRVERGGLQRFLCLVQLLLNDDRLHAFLFERLSQLVELLPRMFG